MMVYVMNRETLVLQPIVMMYYPGKISMLLNDTNKDHLPSLKSIALTSSSLFGEREKKKEGQLWYRL